MLWRFVSIRLEPEFTFNRLGFRIQSSGLAAQSLSGSIDPDVHGLDFVSLREIHVLMLDSFVQF